MNADKRESDYRSAWAGLFVQGSVQSLAIATAHGEARAVAHHDNVLTLRPRLQLLDAVDIHNDGPVDSHESPRIQFQLHPIHSFAHKVRVAAHVESDVVTNCFQPIDIVGPQENYSPS